MSGSHTKENISSKLKEVFDDWAIKPIAIVNCAAHTLQLCINEGLEKDNIKPFTC